MKKRTTIIIFSILALVLAGFIIKSCNKKNINIFLETVYVKKGSVSNQVTATGTIEAIKTVEVGTRVSGEISKIYVDYNSEVKAGQLLAELDRKALKTTLTIAEASLENAKSEVNYQESNFKRIKALFDKKLVAESDYDQTLYSYEKAKTSLKTAQLNYDKARIDLDYAFIYSPIDGVVLSRAVDEGQTVAASFSTPTLFSIANDLTRMQVEASIDEADIGQVKNNQRVEFTVDAYPAQKFEGTVTQIRLEPVVTSNVVTYTVIVEAPNPEKKLMPGMTASISIFVEEANNVLTVASKALRFKPDMSQLMEYQKQEGIEKPIHPQGADFNLTQNIPPEEKQSGKKSTPDSKRIEVWVKNGSKIEPVTVETGIDNDIEVEIKSGLKEGDEVVVSLNSNSPALSENSPQAASSPFMPKPPTRKNSKRN
ncbi:MAG: efflux RND transporter periplasmic adaptor subunit [Bacteroidales bacterium]|nr:efflux RND transporter periplasmic adaptor subunit [Bacteroidales bacterium]